MLLPRRGQGLSTNAIILIILGVIILVVLIAGFSIGWKKINPFLGSSNNVDTVAQQCQIACSTQSTFDYCSVDKTLKIDGNDVGVGSCDDFSQNRDKEGTDISVHKVQIPACPQIQPCSTV